MAFQEFLRDAAEEVAKSVLAENGALCDEFRARVLRSWEPHQQCHICMTIAEQAYTQGARAGQILSCGLDVIVDGPNVTRTFQQVTGVPAQVLDILSLGVLPRLKELGARVVFCGPFGWCSELRRQAAERRVPIDPRCLIEAPGKTDDQFTIEWAVKHDAFIVTNDNYDAHKDRFPQGQCDRYLMKYAWTPIPGDGGWSFALEDAERMKAYSGRAPCARLRPRLAPHVRPTPPLMAPSALPTAEPPLDAPQAHGSRMASYDVSNADAARVIGKGGSMIRALRDAHQLPYPGVRIYVRGNREDESRPRGVDLTGTADAIERVVADLVILGVTLRPSASA